MKMNGSPVRLLASASLVFATLLFTATLAQAQTQTYYLAGAFGRGEGSLIRLPLFGNSKGDLCADLTGTWRVWPAGGGGGATTKPFDFNNPGAITVPGPAMPFGCVPSVPQTVMVNTGGARASFMLPTSFFSQPEDNIPNRQLVPNVERIISLTTDINFYGPLASGPERPVQQSGVVPVTSMNPFGIGTVPQTQLAVWNQFREGAWTTQTGRAGLEFTWCIGNQFCTTVGQGGQGIVKYSNPGETNGFGGTASVILAPGDVAGSLPILSIASGAFGGTSNMQTLGIVPVQAPPPPLGTGAGPGDLGGKGYRAIQPARAANIKVYGAYQISTGGFLTSYTGFIGSIPGTTNTSNQFPWTTGMVLERAVAPTGMGDPGTFTFAATGTDNRTPAGSGNIQLVAGSMRSSTGAGTLTSHFNGMSLTFVPEPGTLGLLAAGALFVVGVTRRRSA
jgi:hypothetical protein